MKRKIEDVKVDMEKLNKIMIKPDTRQRRWEMRKFIGGLCNRCMGIPTKRISYDIGGAQLVEWYCDNCFKYMKEGRSKQVIDKLNSKKDLK